MKKKFNDERVHYDPPEKIVPPGIYKLTEEAEQADRVVYCPYNKKLWSRKEPIHEVTIPTQILAKAIAAKLIIKMEKPPKNFKEKEKPLPDYSNEKYPFSSVAPKLKKVKKDKTE